MKHGLYADPNYILGVAEVVDIQSTMLFPICVERQLPYVAVTFKVTYDFPCLTKIFDLTVSTIPINYQRMVIDQLLIRGLIQFNNR